MNTKIAGLLIMIIFLLNGIVSLDEKQKGNKETLFQTYLPNGDFIVVEKETSEGEIETKVYKSAVDFQIITEPADAYKFSLKLAPKDNQDKNKILWQKQTKRAKSSPKHIWFGDIQVYDVMTSGNLGYLLIRDEIGFIALEQFNLQGEQIASYPTKMPDDWAREKQSVGNTKIILFKPSDALGELVSKGTLTELNGIVFCLLEVGPDKCLKMWKIENGKSAQIWKSDDNSDKKENK